MSNHTFQNPQTQEVITYVRKEYGDELEFLWRKFPRNAIWRNQTNRKWYAALLSVKADRILDDSVPTEQIFALLAQSYQISLRK